MPAKNLSNNSLGILHTDRRKFYLPENTTKELWANSTPFTTILANKGMETDLPDPDYKMFEHRASWFRQQFTIATAPGAWANSGASGALHADEFTIKDKRGLGSGETSADESLIGLVFEVYSSAKAYKGIVTVHDVTGNGVKLRSLGNPRDQEDGHVAALAVDDYCVVMGSAIGEGETSPEAFADDLELVYNSCQIFRTPVEVTGTLHKAALRGYSNELARLRNDKSHEHKIQKERAFLVGNRAAGLKGGSGASGSDAGSHTSNKNNKTVRTTMGIVSAQYRYGSADDTNDDQVVFNRAKASYTYSKFVEDSEKWFWYVPNSGYKTAICGPGAMSYFSQLGDNGFHKGTQRVSVSDLQRDKLKFHFKWVETPHGMLKLIMSPALRYEYNDHMVILDEDNLSMTQYRKMYYATNIKTENNYDGVKDEYFSDEGVKISLLESHKLVILN